MSTFSTADCEMDGTRSKGLSTFAEMSSAAHTPRTRGSNACFTLVILAKRSQNTS